jgi:transposase InsO family protein
MPSNNTNKKIEIPPHILTRHQVLSRIASGYITIPKAAKELNLSEVHTRRLWKQYNMSNGDILSFVPCGRSRPAYVLTNTVQQAISKNLATHPQLSCSHLTDLLNQQGIMISRETVRKELIRTGIHKKRSCSTHTPSTRFEAKSFGSIVQMDTCHGTWIKGERRQYLIACLDDYSRYIVSFSIYTTDSAWTNMCVIRNMIEHYGCPHILYTDNASHFKVIRHESLKPWHNPEQYCTKIQSILTALNIRHIAHHPFNPRAKGKVERFFRFARDRFFKHHTAHNITELNKQFSEWIHWYNNQHVNRTTKQQPCKRLKPSVFKRIPSTRTLNRLFVITETRKVRKDNSVSFKGNQYFIPEKHHVARLTINIHITDTHITLSFKGCELIKHIIIK